MAWTTPKTWTDGSVLTAAELNEQVRDNLNYLFAKPSDIYNVDEAANYTTTSTTFVDVDATDLALTITTGGGDVAVWFSGTVTKNATNNVLTMDVDVDGSRFAGDDGIIYSYGDATIGMSFFVVITGLSAGSHTFKLQWKIAGGNTATMYAGAGTLYLDVHPQFGVREL